VRFVKSPHELAERFRAEGRKVTPQRQRIFDALDGNGEHPTAESVWETVRVDMPSMSLKTVYQTLHELAELGEIQSLDLGTGAARFDPNIDAPQHLVCEDCGRVRDLYADFIGVRVPPDTAQGYVVETTEIVFRGRCPDCAARTATTPAAVVS
jgi:Fe2+ or Zn2+ uptake regulation protein